MPINPLPTPPSRASTPAEFSNQADAFLAALPGFVTETNALQTDVTEKQGIAAAAAETATEKAAICTTKATEAAASADTAQDYAGKTGDVVAPGEYSAKEHAVGDMTATGGSSKAWATDTASPDGSGLKSAKSYAQDAQESASLAESAKTTAVTKAGEASGSAAAAASSAAAATAAAASVGFQDVVFINAASSPYNITQASSGKLIACDTTAGNIAINLPAISTLALPFVVGIKKTTSDSHTVTVNRGGSDTFDDGSTYKSVATPAGFTLLPDTDTSPDVWAAIAFGGANAGPATSSGLTMATRTMLGRNTSGSGAIEEIPEVTEAEARAGTGTDLRAWSPADVAQSIDALGKAKVIRSSRTANVMLTAADFGKLIDITSGTFTQTFAAAATLGDGWWCYYKNSGTGVVTLDPNADETISGALTFVLYPGDSAVIQCDGSAFNIISFPMSAESAVEVNTGNGYGSTNTAIRRFAAVVKNAGTAITYADSATLGASFTINEAGPYEICYYDTYTSGGVAGITKNSNQLTTTIDSGSLTASTLLAWASSAVPNVPAFVSRVVRLSSGDVIRAHAASYVNATTANKTYFSIRKIAR